MDARFTAGIAAFNRHDYFVAHARVEADLERLAAGQRDLDPPVLEATPSITSE